MRTFFILTLGILVLAFHSAFGDEPVNSNENIDIAMNIDSLYDDDAAHDAANYLFEQKPKQLKDQIAILEAMKDSDNYTREKLSNIFREQVVSPEIKLEIMKLLQDPDWSIRPTGARILAKVDPNNTQILP